MAAMAQMSRGALSARPFAPLSKPASARSVTLKAAGSEQLWLPGTERPKHLNGDLPGDRGFDPLVSGRFCSARCALMSPSTAVQGVLAYGNASTADLFIFCLQGLGSEPDRLKW